MSIDLKIRGNLGQNITLKKIQRSGGEEATVLNFSIASTEYRPDNSSGERRYVAGHTEWVECEYWERRAEHLAGILVKGLPVTITGRESIGSYEKDGVVHRTRKIRVEDIYLNLDSTRIESVTLRPPRPNDSEADDAPYWFPAIRNKGGLLPPLATLTLGQTCLNPIFLKSTATATAAVSLSV